MFEVARLERWRTNLGPVRAVAVFMVVIFVGSDAAMLLYGQSLTVIAHADLHGLIAWSVALGAYASVRHASSSAGKSHWLGVSAGVISWVAAAWAMKAFRIGPPLPEAPAVRFGTFAIDALAIGLVLHGLLRPVQPGAGDPVA